QAPALRAAGLHRVTISLDTLRPERFKRLTRRDTHAQVLAGVAAGGRAGWAGLKIGTGGIRGGNDDEPEARVEVGRTGGGGGGVGREGGGGGAVDGVHGGGRGHRLVDGAGDVAGRDAQRARQPLRADRARGRGDIGARRPLPPPRRDDLRHHLVDDAAVLPDV